MYNHRFHLKASSGNDKTGSMAVVTSSHNTCPHNCDFCNGNGCYANYSFMRHWWDQVSKGNVGTGFSGLLKGLKNLPKTKHLRLWDAGDCPGDRTLLDKTRCIQLADALKHRTGLQFGYTHYDMGLAHNRNVIKMMLRRGTIVNVSTLMNNVDMVSKHKLPVAVIVPEPITQTPGGKQIVMCPNQMAKLNGTPKVQCENCMKCAVWPREYAIGFLPHGSGRKIVESIAKAAIDGRVHAKTEFRSKGTSRTRLSRK